MLIAGAGRQWPKRLALIALGLALSLPAAEIALRAAAFVVRQHGGALPAALRGGGPRLLCLGDSNTYGLYLAAADDAWPLRVRAALAADPRWHGVEVANFGYPGKSSSQVRAELPAQLSRLHPDLVLLMIGANDFWTVPQSVTPEAPRNSLGDVLWRHSRVYRLLFMVRRALQKPDAVPFMPISPVVAGTVHGAPPAAGAPPTPATSGATADAVPPPPPRSGVPSWRDDLLANIAAIAAAVRAADARLILLTYPSDVAPYRAANRVLRQAARDTQTPLIDVAAAFQPLCSDAACGQYFFVDHHPNAAGHRYAAEVIAHAVAADGQPQR